MPAPTVRCVGWHTSTGVPMTCAQPGGLVRAGEPGGAEEWGQCRLCMALELKARETAYWRGQRAAHRRLEQHKPDPSRVDWDALTRGR